MSLSSGTSLGPYEIVALIGAGGMGEVYRARDTRLSREVAIKICDSKFSERFAQEASLLRRSIILTFVTSTMSVLTTW